MSSVRARRLVVVRAGDASLHPRWLDGSDAPTFDLAVSYFGDAPTAFSDNALRHSFKGGKWEGIHAFFADNPALIDRYDRIWLPDDDLLVSTRCINGLFDIAEEYDLDLCQPSLTWDSYHSYLITLHNPNFRLRWTSFVEVMAPLFSSAMLRRLLPIFPGRRFGWGLDFVWARWMAEPAFRTAIVDAASVRHTRPIGKGALYREGGADAHKAELDELRSSYGLSKRPRAVVYAGLDTKGRLLRRGPRLWVNLFRGWAPLRKLGHPRGPLPIKTKGFLRRVSRVALPQPDLTPLPLPASHFGRR